LLFEKYVVEIPAMEAIEKLALWNEVKGLIGEEMPNMEDQEIFRGLFGLKKHGIVDKERLQHVGRGD